MGDPRLERAVTRLVATDGQGQPDGSRVGRHYYGVVTAVHTAPTGTGAPWPSVDISLGGVAVPGVRHLDAYAPVVGDTVLVLVVDASPVVIGMLAAGADPSRTFAGAQVTEADLAGAGLAQTVGGGGGVSFGNATNETSTSNPAINVLFGPIVQCATGGTPTVLHVLAATGVTGQTFRAAVYASTSTTPGSRLWVASADLVLPAGQSKQWFTQAVSGLTLVTGSYYWLTLRSVTGATPAGTAAYSTLYWGAVTARGRYVFSSTTPDPAPSPLNTVDQNMAWYMT